MITLLEYYGLLNDRHDLRPSIVVAEDFLRFSGIGECLFTSNSFLKVQIHYINLVVFPVRTS
jgi:hypothetical protein